MSEDTWKLVEANDEMADDQHLTGNEIIIKAETSDNSNDSDEYIASIMSTAAAESESISYLEVNDEWSPASENISAHTKIKMGEKQTATKKKLRQHSKRRWSEHEEQLIINFLHDEKDFEAPTAQVFYTKFLTKTKLDTTWDLVRSKVRYLKSKFQKANDLLTSIEVGMLKQDDVRAIEAKVATICPHFDKLKKIFTKRTARVMPIASADDNSFDTCQKYPTIFASPLNLVPEFFEISRASSSSSSIAVSAVAATSTALVEASTSTVTSTSTTFTSTISLPSPIMTVPASTSTITSYSSAIRTPMQRSSKNYLPSIQKERISFEKYKFEKEMEIEKRKLMIKERKYELKLKLKKLEFKEKWKEKVIDLKKLELEMKERVSKYKIDKKYSH